MADLPISGLPAAGSLDGTELFAVVQGGVTKYTTAQNINYVTSNNYGLFNQTGSSAPQPIGPIASTMRWHRRRPQTHHCATVWPSAGCPNHSQ